MRRLLPRRSLPNGMIAMGTPPADDEIVGAYCADPGQGVWLLLRAHAGRVRKVLSRRYNYVLDEDQIDSAIYDAAQKALSHHDSQRGSLGGWFLFLADRQAVNYLRREEPHRSHTEPLGHRDFCNKHETTPTESLLAAELAAAIQAAMQRELSELERTVLQADLDADGAADAKVLAQSLGNTSWSIYAARARGRAKLLAALTPKYLPPQTED